MAEDNRNIDLEELFRKKLEGSEMEPGSALTGRFMRRLDRREFVRFNPARFNLYYLAMAMAAVTVTAILIFTPSGKSSVKTEINDSLPQPEMIIAAETGHERSVTLPVTMEKQAGRKDTFTARKAHTLPQDAMVPGRKNETITSSRAGDAGIAVAKEPSKIGLSIKAAGLPVPVMEASVTSGCVPLRVSFRNATSGTFSTVWSFGDGGSSDKNSTDYIYDLPGYYTVTLTLTDASGLKSATSTSVEVWPVPEAAFEIPETDVSITEGQIVFANLSTGATQYLWDFGDGIFSGLAEPAHKYRNYGNYDVTLIAFTVNGCADSVTVTDAFTDSGLSIRFPNAFIPNTGGPTGGYYSQRSDEANQVFHPVSTGVSTYNLKVYSKQGMLVFESDDLYMGWDGYYKGQLCSPGVYIWKVRGSYKNGQPVVMSGDVTLLNY
jgi:PKD repeat protein